MSFTLVRYKDGKEIPIKVSILDAFRSAPPRRPKAVQPEKKLASQPENKSSPVDKDSNSKTTTDDNANKDSSNLKNFSNHDEETYTAGDDAKIIAMKGENKSWKQIMEATGKESESQLKNHYKLHLGPNAKEEQQKLADKLAKAEKNKAEGLAKQADGQEKKEDGGGGDEGKKGGGGGGGKKNGSGGGNNGGGGGGGGGGKKNKAKEKAKGQEESKEGKDTPEALTKQNLRAFVAKYERDKWLAAASRHYDLTGQRISPEAAKKMADGK